MSYEPADLRSLPVSRIAAALAVFEADRRGIQEQFDAPWSPERGRRYEALLDAWERWLHAVEWHDLSPIDRADAILFGNLIAAERAELDLDRSRLAEMASLCPFSVDLVRLLDEWRLMDDLDPARAAERLHAALCAIRETQRSCGEVSSEARAAPAGRAAAVANRASQLMADLKLGLERWRDFHSGYDPIFTWWNTQPCAELVKALEEFSVYLREKVAGAESPETIIGDPVGREALLAELEAACIPYGPEELIAIGEREAQWCRRQMLEAARDMGCGEDWRAALERVKQDHAPPGDQARLVRDLAREAVAFIEERDLISIPEPARDGWHMEMMAPDRQKVNPFFLGGEAIIISYPTAEMEHERKLMSMRGNNRHFSRATVQHELIPGHFLQHFHQSRYLPHRRMFHTPFWTEGWALYWEMRLWELGFPRTPEERMGMLFWRMHRSVRVVFSLRFHLGEMTPQECVDMLVDEVGHERATAEGEVRRSFGGDYQPLYQCAYQIGGLQMRALQREIVGEGRMTDRQFHDAVLRENCMPLAMLRAILLGEPLERGFRPEWRFAGADA